MFLISDVRPRVRRRFHYLDALALLVAISVGKKTTQSAKKTILSQTASLLCGDRAGLAEAAERRAAVAAYRESSDAARAKSDKMLYRQQVARREEIRRDPWSAGPWWWSRDVNRNFALFICGDNTFICGLFDRRVNGGSVPLDYLEKLGVVAWVNLTVWFVRADAQLAAIVNARRVEA